MEETLKTNNKLTAINRSNNTTSTPLTGKITTATGRPKTFEKQREIEPYAGLDSLNNRHSTRTDAAEAEIIPGVPNKKLTNIKNIHKNTRKGAQLI